MHEHQGTPSWSAGAEHGALGRLKIPATPEEVAPARHWLGELLAADHAAVADDVVLMACEAITNAIRHSDSGRPDAQGALGVVMLVVRDIGGTLRVEVTDAGSRSSVPRLTDGGPDALSGRGLHLIDLLSGGRWGTGTHDQGRTVWFETCS